MDQKLSRGEETYVLREINVSAVFPFPEPATAKIAQAAAISFSRAASDPPVGGHF